VNRPSVPAFDLAITDIAPTVLALLGLRAPEPLDGRVLGV